MSEAYSIDRGEPPQDCLIGDNGAITRFESINVGAPQLISSRLFGSYNVYPITAVPNVGGEITRRFSEFEWLYNQLIASYPGVLVPALPAKKLFGNTSASFVESYRRPALERMLIRISQIPILAESALFQAFMTRSHSFDVFQKEFAKKLAARTQDQLIKTYEYYFAKALSQDLPVTIEQDIVALTEYLRNKEVQYTELASVTEDLQETIAKQLKLLTKYSVALGNSEQSDATFQFVPTTATKVSLTDTVGQWSEQTKELEPTYSQNVSQQYAHDLEDVINFQALCLAERKNAKYKADKAEKRAASWNAPGVKCATEKERNQRAMDIQTAEDEQKLYTIITKLIWFEEFQQMYAKNIQEYNTNMVGFANAQSSFAQLCYHNWEGFKNANPAPAGQLE